jgi:ribosomal protein L24E
VSLTPCADFYRPVEELEYTDLLRSTFTQSGHERGFKTWRTPATLPQCVFCGNKYRWGKGEVECHMDPTITKASTDNERLVAACAESQSTSRAPNRTRFLAVQEVIRTKMQCDKKTLLADADASKKGTCCWLEDMQTILWICVEKTMLMQRIRRNSIWILCNNERVYYQHQENLRYGSRVTMSERMINTKRI